MTDIVYQTFKGESSPKNENSAIISCSKPLWVSFFCWTQKNVGNQTVDCSQWLP